MTSFFDLGDKSSSVKNLLPIGVDVPQGDNITVKNVSGDTISYYSNTTSTAAGTITATNSQTFTAPVYISSAGRSTVQVSSTAGQGIPDPQHTSKGKH